jgi:hypothetical protein
MRIFFRRREWTRQSGATQTLVRIDMRRNPDAYHYRWSVADPRRKRLSKQELHELNMRVAKYAAVLNQDAPLEPERLTVFATL